MGLKFQSKEGPESKIQAAIVKKLTLLKWFVLETHGNMFQRGLPDIYATHRLYGARWIEVKNPESYSFTAAQVSTFPLLVANGAGVWILISDEDSEIKKLMKPCNWYQYFK